MVRKLKQVAYTYIVCENPNCGKQFYGRRKTGIYCCNACKQFMYRQRQEQRAAAQAAAEALQPRLF